MKKKVLFFKAILQYLKKRCEAHYFLKKIF